MRPEPVIQGKVVGPAGNAVTEFRLIPDPEAMPDGMRYETVSVSDPKGLFALRATTDEPFGVVVAADGYAPCRQQVQCNPQGSITEIALSEGHSIYGHVTVERAAAEDLRIELRPTRYVLGNDLLSMDVAVNADGTFRLEHVADGVYRLMLHGPRITPVVLHLDVDATDVDVGDLAPRGTGQLRGRVCYPGSDAPRSLALGAAWHEPSGERVLFMADENGRFRLDDVPVGKIVIGFGQSWSGCIIQPPLTGTVQIHEGQVNGIVIR